MTRALESTVLRGTEGTTLRALEGEVTGGMTDPTDLADLLSWYDASDPLSFTYSSGVRVATWADLSGAGRHLNVGGGGPTGPDRTGTRNGLPILSFNENGLVYQAMERWHATNKYYTGAPLTVVVVCRVRSDLGANPRVVSFTEEPNQDWQTPGGGVPLGIDSGKYPSGYRTGTGGGAQLPGGSNLAAMGTWHAHVIVFDGVTCTTYMNSATPLGTVANAGTFNFNWLQIGRGTGGQCDVEIGDVFMLSHASDVVEVADIMAWADAKWVLATVPLINETFTGTNGAAWSSTNWAFVTSNGVRVTIQNNKGQVVTEAVAFGQEQMFLTEGPDDFYLTFDMSIADNTNGGYFQIQYRQNTGGGGGFPGSAIELQMQSGGSLNLTNIGGTGSVTVTPPAFVGGDIIHWKIRVAGPVHQVKLWVNSDPEPGTWTIDALDTAPTKLTGAGQTLFVAKTAGAGDSKTYTLDNIVLYNTPDPIL